MLLLLSRSGSSSTYEEFYKYSKEMEEKIWEKLNMFFLVLFLWIVWAAQIKSKALLRTKKKKVVLNLALKLKKGKVFWQTPLKSGKTWENGEENLATERNGETMNLKEVVNFFFEVKVVIKQEIL